MKSRILYSIACVYGALGEYGQSLDYSNQVVTLCEQTDDISLLVTTINDIGVTYGDTNDHERALQAYKKALHMAEAHDVVRMQAIALRAYAHPAKQT